MSRDRLGAIASHVAFGAGLAGVAIGALAGDLGRLADIGAGLAIGATPFVILARVRRSTRITEADKEALRREGYRLALDHAARGLLKPPPLHGGREGIPAASGATVHRLRLVDRKEGQRRA